MNYQYKERNTSHCRGKSAFKRNLGRSGRMDPWRNGVGNVLLEKGNFSYRTDIKAEDFLYEMLQKYPQELTLVTLGRLTNIAMMVQKYPESTKLVKIW